MRGVSRVPFHGRHTRGRFGRSSRSRLRLSPVAAPPLGGSERGAGTRRTRPQRAWRVARGRRIRSPRGPSSRPRRLAPPPPAIHPPRPHHRPPPPPPPGGRRRRGRGRGSLRARRAARGAGRGAPPPRVGRPHPPPLDGTLMLRELAQTRQLFLEPQGLLPPLAMPSLPAMRSKPSS